MKNQRVAIVAGLVATPFAVAVLEGPALLPQTFRQATSKQPTAFSELYFMESGALPKALKPNQPAKVHFVIVNREAAQHVYAYQVLIIKNGAATQTSAKVSLRDGQSTTQSVTIPAAAPGDKLQIVVRLPEKNQEIRFRAEVSS